MSCLDGHLLTFSITIGFKKKYTYLGIKPSFSRQSVRGGSPPLLRDQCATNQFFIRANSKADPTHVFDEQPQRAHDGSTAGPTGTRVEAHVHHDAVDAPAAVHVSQDGVVPLRSHHGHRQAAACRAAQCGSDRASRCGDGGAF